MPPRSSSATSSSGSSSSSSSSSSGSDSSSDSGSSTSQGSGRSKKSVSSRSNSSSEERGVSKKNRNDVGKKKSSTKEQSEAETSSDNEDLEKSSNKKTSKSSKKSSKAKSSSSSSRAVPKKSATAKPIVSKSSSSVASKKASQLSDRDSDSDFGDFSLPKLTAKAKQAKKAAAEAIAAASSSPASQNSPSVASPLTTSTTPTTSTKCGAGAAAKSVAFATTTPTSSKPVSTSALSGKIAVEAAVASDKYKSIFSESSGSESDKNRTKRSPSPPKLTPQKNVKKRGRPAGRVKTSSGSSGNKTSKSKKKITPRRSSPSSDATTSRSRSRSRSASSDHESRDVKSKLKTHTSTVARGKSDGDGRKKSAGTKSEVQVNSKKATKQETVRPTTRGQSRGSNVRKSRHVTGKNVTESDSEIEGTSTVTIGVTQPVTSGIANVRKQSIPQLPPVRHDIDGLPPIETRKCPLPECDSLGHLGGKLDRHFLLESCPLYHNLSRRACRDFQIDIAKRSNARSKALASLTSKSPLASLSSDQKRNAQMIQRARLDFHEDRIPETDDLPEDREPNLDGFTSEWDLQIFREAQAAASEGAENALRGLPDTKQTRFIEMGQYEMEVWYQSPYPDDFSSLPKIYICEFCLKYHKSVTQLRRHEAKCVWNHPPGDEIYRKEPLTVFEICGKRYKQYCQNLCLLAKFFLDHKTLYFDVEPFLFYVMCVADSAGCHMVGYFSKEKNSVLNYNVSCILTLPPYQRQGYGRLLIDFSYLLSRVEGKMGSPEKPLSDLGLITYRAYWKDVLLEYICNYPEKEISIKAFCEDMGINPNDIISTLQYMGMIKYWKGQHLILKREDLINDYLEKSKKRPKGRNIYPNALRWKPYQPSAKERKQAEQIKKSHIKVGKHSHKTSK